MSTKRDIAPPSGACPYSTTRELLLFKFTYPWKLSKKRNLEQSGIYWGRPPVHTELFTRGNSRETSSLKLPDSSVGNPHTKYTSSEQ